MQYVWSRHATMDGFKEILVGNGAHTLSVFSLTYFLVRFNFIHS